MIEVQQAFGYDGAPVEVGDSLKAAHRFLWEHISQAGTWLSAAQRVAVAAEARRATRCRLCQERKQALSAASVSGLHESDGELPEAVVEVVHRVRSDPARLSRSWFDQLVPKQLSAATYVEVVSLCALLSGVDFFARSLGAAATPLPKPREGKPSHDLPAGARDAGAWVPMLAPEDLAAAEADLYGGAPVVPNIVRALSLVPAEVRALRRCIEAHYVPLPKLSDPSARRALDRAQIELVAARVSALNQCFY